MKIGSFLLTPVRHRTPATTAAAAPTTRRSPTRIWAMGAAGSGASGSGFYFSNESVFFGCCVLYLQASPNDRRNASISSVIGSMWAGSVVIGEARHVPLPVYFNSEKCRNFLICRYSLFNIFVNFCVLLIYLFSNIFYYINFLINTSIVVVSFLTSYTAFSRNFRNFYFMVNSRKVSRRLSFLTWIISIILVSAIFFDQNLA